MWTLQKNDMAGKTEKTPFEDMFVWNSFLTREFRMQLKTTHWIVPLVHGFFKQVNVLMPIGD
jgi:hypothetical protein